MAQEMVAVTPMTRRAGVIKRSSVSSLRSVEHQDQRRSFIRARLRPLHLVVRLRGKVDQGHDCMFHDWRDVKSRC